VHFFALSQFPLPDLFVTAVQYGPFFEDVVAVVRLKFSSQILDFFCVKIAGITSELICAKAADKCMPLPIHI
jgi:hypothetical protein